MTRAYAFWLQFALAIALVFNAGCGDGSGGDDDDRDGNGRRDGGDTNGDGEDFIADTSGFDGLLTWTFGNRLGVFVWDLPNSELIFERRGNEDEAIFPGEPSLSRDGSTLVYTAFTPFLLGTLFGEVTVRDLETGTEEAYPTTGLSAAHQRDTTNPSISADGRFVAVAEKNFEWVETEFGRNIENETERAIQIWDRTSGELTYITDGSFKAYAPRISADGSKVLFLSNQHSALDLYMANTSAPFEIERVTTFADETELRLGSSFSSAPGKISYSDDLRYVAFIAETEDSSAQAAFILDTQTKAIERAVIQPIDVTLGEDANVWLRSIAMSGDGSTLAYAVYYMDIYVDEGEVITSRQILRAPRTNPSSTVLIAEDSGITAGMDPSGLALSADGAQIAYSLALEELWVNLIDGSDPQKVISAEQDRVGTDFDLSMSLSF